MAEHPIYNERLTSRKTVSLFWGLSLQFLVLCIWRFTSGIGDGLTIVLFAGFIFFLFYALNFRTLQIQITPVVFRLRFGIFSWVIPLADVEGSQLDQLPFLMKYGGAGVHFMFVRSRYRVSFNFLEHPRVVLLLKKHRGIIRDVSFSTRRPNDVLRILEGESVKER